MQQLEQLQEWTTEELPSVDDAGAAAVRVISFKYLPETDSICTILSNGQIELLALFTLVVRLA